MWSQERHQRILAQLQAYQRVTTDDLARTLDVSRETVRRDLLELEAAGALRRVHGGAVALEPSAEEPFRQRLSLRRREKQAIARAARALLHPGQSCFIDAGSTTLLFAEELGKISGITVITNSVDVAATLRRQDPQAEVLLLGGRLASEVPATYGELTLSEIARFQVDMAFISPVGVHPQRGVTNYEFHEAEVARVMLNHADRLVVLADHEKIGRVSRVQICGAQKIATLVTNAGAPPEICSALGTAGADSVVLAPLV
jgi:DeoR/GlpR family transcriptional regulator of sugar metabolism